ncbi:MAG: hypothetical protein ACOVP5_08125, partial [Chitinophagales bacterium]
MITLFLFKIKRYCAENLIFTSMKYIVLISVLFASISCKYFQKDEPAKVPKDALESKIFAI